MIKTNIKTNVVSETEATKKKRPTSKILSTMPKIISRKYPLSPHS